MKDISELAKSLRALDDKIVRCMRCGTCQSVCPVFAETMCEADVTRGKLALISDLSSKMLSDAEGVRERLDRCLLCGSCQAACPSGVSIMDIFLEARRINAAYMGLPFLKKIIFRGVLANPRLFNFMIDVSAPFRKIFLRDEKNAPHTACSPLIKIAMGDRRVPVMPSETFGKKRGRIDIPAGKSGLRVLFFPGCMGDKVYTNVTEACQKIFAHHGVGVVIPESMACCGIPALASGDVGSFKSMLAQDLDIFAKEKFDYVVTACASCTETIHAFWPKHAEGTPRAAYAEETAKKAMDISAFLVDVLKIKAAGAPAGGVKVTYHDSCHLKKSLGISSQPRELLKSNPNYELVEMSECDRCCGCGGSFTLTHYDLSKAVGQRKRDNVVKSGASVVSAGCPACMMQLSNMLALNGDNVQVKHVAEIYAESLEK